jgi:hypothetical protein
MRYLKTFSSLTEAVSLPIARKATEIFLSSGGKQRYNEVFNGKDRLYYDLDDDLNNRYIYNPLEDKIKIALDNSGYSILDYNKGIATKNGDEKNVFKIQKILNKIGESDLKNKMDADPIRFSSTKKDKMIVISRHGIDIAGQSTGRKWTSCKHVENINGRYVWTEIEQGSLVAYLTTPEDINIENPIARILIGVYVNEKDNSDFVLYPDSSIYGNYAKQDFPDFVKKWCIDTNKKISPKQTGEYKLSSKCYTDTVKSVKIINKPFDDIRAYMGTSPKNMPSMVDVFTGELSKDDIKNIFKYIESQTPDLTYKEGFDFIKKINSDISRIDYAEFINGNSYTDLKKYLDKHPDLFVNYMGNVDYNLINDKNKENQIRELIKKEMKETGGEDYAESLRDLLNNNSPRIPADFIRWVLS